MEKKQTEMEIDLWDVFNILWNKAGFIVLFGLFVALLTFGYTQFFVTPQYSSTTKIYVMSQQDEKTLTQGDMQTSTYLTKDYVEMIKSRTVTENVIQQMGLDMDSDSLLEKMEVSIASDARIISISVQDADPYRAAMIADEVREAASEQIYNVMDIEAVNVVEVANVPLMKSSPAVTKYTILGGLAGSILVATIILLISLMNDTIKISEDIEKELGISVLSVIPVREDCEKGKVKSKGPLKREKKKGN